MSKLVIVLLVGVCCITAIPASAQLSLWVTSYPNLLPVNSNYGYFLAGPFDGYYGQSPTDIDFLPDGEHVGALYCIDLHHDIVVDPDEFYAVDNVNTIGNFYDQPDRTGDLTQVAWLTNNYAGQADGDPYLEGSLQVAIWSILYPSYQYNYGLPDLNQVSFYETVSAGQHATNYEWYDYQGPDPGGQDTIRAVPEPASLFLLGSGLVGLAFIRRRRK